MLGEDIFPFVIGFGLCVLLPVVAILTSHQRKMAELIHKRGQAGDPADVRIRKLEMDVAELQMRLSEQILRTDDQLVALERLRATPPPAPNPEQRHLSQ